MYGLVLQTEQQQYQLVLVSSATFCLNGRQKGAAWLRKERTVDVETTAFVCVL